MDEPPDTWNPLIPRHFGVSKFAADGQLVWTRIIDDPEVVSFRAGGVVSTSDGNVSVVGFGTPYDQRVVVASYDAAGTLRWIHLLNGVSVPLIAAGPAGSVVVALRELNQGWRLVRYAADGTTVFDVSRFLAGSMPFAIAVDSAGATFLAGYRPSPPFPQSGRPDGLLVKFSPAGAEGWNVPLPDYGGALAVDDEGGVVAAVGYHMTTTAVDADGGVRWRREVGGVGYPYAILRDRAGRWIVAGNDGVAAVTAVYDDDGTLVWSRTWRGPGVHATFGTALSLDGAGGVHVAAVNQKGIAQTRKIDNEILHYDATGALLSIASARTYINDQNPRASLLAADGAGGVVLAGPGLVHLQNDRDVTSARIVKLAGTPASGTGRAATRERLRFGGVRIADYWMQRSLRIRNRSRTEPLVVRVDAADAPFSGGGITRDIAPGAVLKVGLSFIPKVAGTTRRTLTITTSDPQRPSLQVELSGTGK
jgi:hypothetical protein